MPTKEQALKQLERELRAEVNENGVTEQSKRIAAAIRTLSKPSIGEAFGLGTERGGERLWAGGEEALTFASTSPFSEEAREKREDIKTREARFEELYRHNVKGAEVPAFIGEMVAPGIASGGRTPLTAMARGSLTGALSYTPDLGTAEGAGTRALQSGLGLLGGLGGQQLVNRMTSKGREIARAGLRANPEDVAPTLKGPASVYGLKSFQREMFKNAEFNQKKVTEAVMKDIGADGKAFSGEIAKTKYGIIPKEIDDLGFRAKKLYHEVLNSKEKIYVSKDDIGFIEDFYSPENVSQKGKKAAARYAKDIRSAVAKNEGIIPVSEFQRIRSDITEDILRASSRKKKHTLGELVGWLDRKASLNFSGDTKQKFDQGRELFRKYYFYESLANKGGQKRKGINLATGLVDPGQYDNLLMNTGFNEGAAPKLMDINRKITGATEIRAKPGVDRYPGNLRARMTPEGMALITDTFLNRPIGRAALTANRAIPQIIGDTPPALVPPAMQLSPLLEE